jgi:hypothetical protein
VDVDVEIDVEGPGAEEGDGWSNFLCFARVTGADGVLVELQRLSVVADVLEPILSTVDWNLNAQNDGRIQVVAQPIKLKHDVVQAPASSEPSIGRIHIQLLIR